MLSTEKAFNAAAHSYDQDFTLSSIGKLQRARVLSYIENNIELNKKPLNILELNCGTGYDALHFLERGHSVMATDLSMEMLSATKKRTEKYISSGLMNVMRLDLSDPSQFPSNQKFDLVFSNFAGLNCLEKSSLQEVINKVADVLKPNARFVTIMLSRSCLWEQLYFTLKRKPEQALRRKSVGPVSAHVSGEYVDTYYFSPDEFYSISEGRFEKVGLRPIGIFIPPSYLEPAFQNRPKALAILNTLEKRVGHFSLLADRADHYLIDLKKLN